MLSIIINGEKSTYSAFLNELRFQHLLATRAYKKLKLQSDYEKRCAPHDFKPGSPVELLTDCVVFLSASGIVAKILFNNKAPKRCGTLREILEIGDLPNLRSLSVRNSFEHIDERLDKFLTENSHPTFIQYHLTRHPPQAGMVLKRFNPIEMTISYLDDALPIQGCYAELELVNNAVNSVTYEKIKSITTSRPKKASAGRG